MLHLPVATILAPLRRYTEAYDHVGDALMEHIDLDQERAAHEMIAVVFANRAAVHLVDGPEMDAKEALQDGERAESFDPTYAKAYIRQARAHQILGDVGRAQDCVVRALRRPDLENNQGLVDRLIDLQTEGKGLLDDDEAFKEWMESVVPKMEGGWRGMAKAVYCSESVNLVCLINFDLLGKRR